MLALLGNRFKLASEPKDRIFSLISVFERCGIHITAPDYDRSMDVPN